MKFPTPIPISRIAEKYHCEIIGDASILATGINEIHKVEPGDIMFVDNEKYFEKSLSSAASIILLNKRIECPEGKVLLLCEEPFEVYDSIVKANRPFQSIACFVQDGVRIASPTAKGQLRIGGCFFIVIMIDNGVGGNGRRTSTS